MRRAVSTLALLACATLVLTACGDGEQTTGQAATTSASPADCTQGGKFPTSPTVESLTGLLKKGLDPAVASSDKIELLQGASGDPELFNRMLPALDQADFAVTINDVTDYCNGTANADATLNFYGQPNQSQVPLVAEEGRWKLERVWACGLAASLQQTSPICT
jgi:hypothetical protein